jgi:hypothetical protein
MGLIRMAGGVATCVRSPEEAVSVVTETLNLRWVGYNHGPDAHAVGDRGDAGFGGYRFFPLGRKE